jgi:hypothetical protein
LSAQGWVAGTDGFTRTHDFLAWMIWLALVAWRAQDFEPAPPGNEGVGRRDA